MMVDFFQLVKTIYPLLPSWLYIFWEWFIPSDVSVTQLLKNTFSTQAKWSDKSKRVIKRGKDRQAAAVGPRLIFQADVKAEGVHFLSTIECQVHILMGLDPVVEVQWLLLFLKELGRQAASLFENWWNIHEACNTWSCGEEKTPEVKKCLSKIIVQQDHKT